MAAFETEEQMLRLGIARVAQILDLDPYIHVPGHPVDWSTKALMAAVREPNGWSALVVQITYAIKQREQYWHGMVKRLNRVLNDVN